MAEAIFGAVEAGGTKIRCAIGTRSGRLIHEACIPTLEPAETMENVNAFFRPHDHELTAIGIASFGPLQLDQSAPNYGFITSTPKESWRNFNVVGSVRREFKIPVGFDTDVNASALAENEWGAARGLKTFLYITVGTGIGGGAIVEGLLLHGRLHPEMGHIRVPHNRDADPFPGECPFHGDCLEGLASGSAMESRWGVAASLLGVDHAAWKLEADYLALACADWIFTFSPERIVFGGGVMQPHLFGPLRECVSRLVGGYLDLPEMSDYIVPSALQDRSGLLGALVLAARAAGLN